MAVAPSPIRVPPARSQPVVDAERGDAVRRGDLLPAVVLYVVAVAVNLASAWAVSRSLVLTGEEMSVSIRDPLFTFGTRTQATVWSTNFAAPIYYWVASYLDPAYSLFSARRWKAVAMALLPPLVYLVLRRRLRCSRVSATLGGLTAALVPGVMMFGWLATDNGFESLAGTAGLYVATSRRAWWRVAPVFGGIAVTTYGSGMAWAAVIVAVCAWRAWRARTQRRHEILAFASTSAIAAVIVVFPRLWWTGGPQRIVAGGGTFEGTLRDNAATLVRQLAVSGDSYYFFGSQAALGSAPLAAAVVVAACVAWVRPEVRPWYAVAAVTVLMWLPTGHLPGVRRAVAISIVAALVLAVAVDVVGRLLPRRSMAVTLAAAAACVLPLAGTAAAWQLSYAGGERALVADFPIAPGPMPPTFAAWEARLRDGTLTVEQMAAHHDGIRTLAVVWMLADRQGRGTEGLPTPREIVAATVDTSMLPSDVRALAEPGAG